MTYTPVDSFSRGPVPLPNLVGGRVEAAFEYGRMNGWTVHERPLEPATKDQPDGLVVAQVPQAGVVLDGGDVVLVDVIRRVPFAKKHAVGLVTALALVMAALAVVFGAVLLTDDGSGSSADLDAANARITELEVQVAAASGNDGALVATLQQQLADATARADAAEAQVAEVQAKLDQATTDLATVTAERDALVAERDALLQQVADLQAQLSGITSQVIATPDFTGQQQVAVEEFVRLNSLVLVVQEVDVVDGTPLEPGAVVAQVPAQGTPLVKGAAVVITVYTPAG
ncbi:MAG: PASTA domain-containing protein [Ilumatobacteraceae bacterium]